MSATKGPSAVVLLTRGDRVLGLTRGPLSWHDWHLPGGKWEPIDGWTRWGDLTPSGLVEEQGEPDLRETAIRELREETRVALGLLQISPLVAYVTRSGRPVQAFRGEAPDWLPEHLGPTAAGQPAWVPPGMLTMPWCSFGPECRIVLAAAGLVDG
jgi:8-oxo-dGTP pyrophosphatase MutT (NUDIX family)